MNVSSEESNRPDWRIALGIGLTGVAIGAIIGATTGMWWMMGVLGGAFGGMASYNARKRT